MYAHWESGYDVQASGASRYRDPRTAFDFRFEAPPLCWTGVGLLAWIAVALVWFAAVALVLRIDVVLVLRINVVPLRSPDVDQLPAAG